MPPNPYPSDIGDFVIGFSPIEGADVPPPSPGDPTPYLDRVTSEHQPRTKFMAALLASVQPFADALVVLNELPTLFDLDTAVGQQLDFTGQWIGPTRQLQVPLANVFFTWDTAGVGWDQGVWLGPFEPSTGLVTLGDDLYRKLLIATVAANTWDGSIPAAYTSLNDLFAPLRIKIKDHGDMTMTLTLVGSPDAVTAQLFTSGVLSLRPAGVSADYVITP